MNLLILGANSSVAHAAARIFASREKAGICLASRDMDLLQKKARDLTARYGVKATAIFLDATDYSSHQGFYSNLETKPDGVLLAFGYLGDQEKAQQDFNKAKSIIETNFLGAVSLLEIIAADFEKRKAGFIIGVSSVAGERGRQSNYIYGSSKGALTLYLGGLRNRLFKSKVHVMTVLPGFIRTKMTDGLALPEKLMASPEAVAEDIYTAYIKKKDIVYTKWFWHFIMLIIRSIPEMVFKRMRL